MSELTTIDTNNYAAMAQMMGMAYDTGEKKSSLARLRINKKSIMGDADVNGKTMKMEIVSAGALGLQNTDNQVIYADKVVLRPFLQRFMYQRYDSNANNYQKTVMANSLDIDLKDTGGTFNCGKPGGYIQDFDALPDSTKELIRQIRRVRVVFGTASMSGVSKEGVTHKRLLTCLVFGKWIARKVSRMWVRLSVSWVRCIVFPHSIT